LVDDDGVPTGTTGVAIDVTERERHNAAVAQALVQQHETVEVLQRALLPTALPTVPRTEVAARYVAAQKTPPVGGDWYAVLPVLDGRLGVAIGDVAGHGLDAVADMAAVRFSLRAIALDEAAPELVLDRLNHVVHVFESDTMVTALYGVLDPKVGTWSYASAGHCPAVVRNLDGSVRSLDERCDPPLGVGRDPYRRRRAEIQPGSTLVLYTDGLVERRSEVISIGLERLERACQAGPAEPENLCDYLAETMLEPSSIEDDVAIVAVRYGV
jgi:serine phosphatase RsbU (regulator of sigma subunit)